MRLGVFALKVAKNFVSLELAEGTLGATLKQSRAKKTLASTRKFYFGDMIEKKAKKYPDNKFVLFRDYSVTYKQADENSNRVANGMINLGAKTGDGIALFSLNSPRFYDFFYGPLKMGMYAVPTNTALRGRQLIHILNNSEVKSVLVHHSLYEYFEKIRAEVPGVKTVIIDTLDAPKDYKLPAGAVSIDDFYKEGTSTVRPPDRPVDGSVSVLMYTSGTTGLPKGVVYRHGDTRMGMAEALFRAIAKPGDIFYTCLPLFHANALFITTTSAMSVGGPVALSQKFSATKFWDEVRYFNATSFNLLGAMIPILLKQPPRPSDRDHKVRLIVTSACPADMWEKFEKRFGLEIWEGYGAVDGGGVLIMNIGNAPKGSIGKPMGSKVRVVDEAGNDVPVRKPGELIIKMGEKKEKKDKAEGGGVEYYKNEEASSKKTRDGWLYTGDHVYQDEKGNLYFVGRDSETLRRRGENVSTYEVETEILKHPSIQECAVYGVKAELGEDDIMASVVLVEGRTLDPKELIEFLSDKIAYFAIPRYIRVVPDLPKTETHRVQKKALQEIGVAPDTWDAEKHGIKPGKK